MKNYRVTFAFDREEIMTFILESPCLLEAIVDARIYVEEECKATFNDLVGIGIVEIEI